MDIKLELRERNESVSMASVNSWKLGYNHAIEEFEHELKETLNQEFPRNYKSTQPFFTLENVRMLIDSKAEELKKI